MEISKPRQTLPSVADPALRGGIGLGLEKMIPRCAFQHQLLSNSVASLNKRTKKWDTHWKFITFSQFISNFLTLMRTGKVKLSDQCSQTYTFWLHIHKEFQHEHGNRYGVTENLHQKMFKWSEPLYICDCILALWESNLQMIPLHLKPFCSSRQNISVCVRQNNFMP